MSDESFMQLLERINKNNDTDPNIVRKLYHSTLEMLNLSIEHLDDFRKRDLDRTVEFMNKEINTVLLRAFMIYSSNPTRYNEKHDEIYRILSIENIPKTFGFYELQSKIFDLLSDFYGAFYTILRTNVVNENELLKLKYRLKDLEYKSIDMANLFVSYYHESVDNFVNKNKIEIERFCDFNNKTLSIVNKHFTSVMKKMWNDLLKINDRCFDCYVHIFTEV